MNSVQFRTDELGSIPDILLPGFGDSVGAYFLNQGFESGLAQYGKIIIDLHLDEFQLGGYSDTQWNTPITFHPGNPQTTSIQLSMDGMLVGPWIN
jgi:hypothetical protein